MDEILNALFRGNSEKSKIEINETCSDCKKDIIIEIVHTTGGFGFRGGALFKSSAGGYYARCPDCYKVNSLMVNR